MQQESSSSSSSGNNSLIGMKQFSPTSKIRPSVTDLMMSQPQYSSIFFQSASTSPATSPMSVNSAPISGNSGGGGAATSSAISSLSRLMSDHQELLTRHAFCLSQLQKTFKEAETLRQENTNLRIANRDLGDQLSLLVQAALQELYQKNTTTMSSVPQSFPDHHASLPLSEKFTVGLLTGGAAGGREEKKQRESEGWEEGFSSESPTSVIENNDQSDSQNVDPNRVTLPKSISVRSNGFLKMSQQGGAGGGLTGNSSGLVRGATRIRAQSPVTGPQKVYVRGGNKKEGSIELEVYNQGMFKTELCNKWQETGTCPYGDHCQFAHGIGELRPVIRHPRYKTEVCRMVLSGDPCPYGHRCHFRHALTEQEKLMMPLRLD